MTFKDHFSTQSDIYAKYRPKYPPALFDYLASITPDTQQAWDCASGSGQCATGLRNSFVHVIATDGSESQVVHATHEKNISYMVSVSEQIAIRSNTIDLVTVAQALHWFDFEKFYAEVNRVLRPGGLIATWCYTLCQISPQIDQIIFELNYNTLGEYWSPEIYHVDGGYATIPFPYKEEKTPEFKIQAQWDFLEFIGFLSTWTAVKKFVQTHNRSPIAIFYKKLLHAWGDEETTKEITWPIHMRVGRLK